MLDEERKIREQFLLWSQVEVDRYSARGVTKAEAVTDDQQASLTPLVSFLLFFVWVFSTKRVKNAACAVLILFSFFAHPSSSSSSGDCKTSARSGCRRRRLYSHGVRSSRISNPMDSLASEWKSCAFQWFCSSNNKSPLSSHWRLPLCGRKCGGKCIGLCSPCCKRSVCFVHIPVNRERVMGSRDRPRTLAFLDFFHKCFLEKVKVFAIIFKDDGTL